MTAATERNIHRLVVTVLLLPFASVAIRAYLDQLGANPVEAMTHVTGEFGLRCLLLCLAVTPLRRFTGWRGLLPYRRSFGLLAFFYGTAHFCVYLFFDLGFDFSVLIDEVIERPYITVGFATLSLMTPLAVTSTRSWQRRLGRRWVSLHRLVYPAAILAVVHFWWLVKADLTGPALHALVLALLLVARWRPAPASG